MSVSRRWEKRFQKAIEGIDSTINVNMQVIMCSHVSGEPEQRRWQLLWRKAERLRELGLVEEGSRDDALEGVWWPLFFDDAYRGDERLDVCAVCFGALTYAEQLKDAEISPRNDSCAKKAMITLVSLREDGNPRASLRTGARGAFLSGRARVRLRCFGIKKWEMRPAGSPSLSGSWPTEVFLDGTGRTTPGTVNQTTLALSALINLGFLDVDSCSVFEARLRFIEESVTWLKESRCRYATMGLWERSPTYGEKQEGSTLQTSYVYNTLNKLIAELRRNRGKCSGNEKTKKQIVSMLDNLNELTRSIESFFRKTNIASGACSSYSPVKRSEEASFLSSCQLFHAMANGNPERAQIELLRRLGRFITDAKWDSDMLTRKELLEKADGLDVKALPAGGMRYFTSDTCFDIAEITLPKGGKMIDHFEVSPYTITIMALLKMLEVDREYTKMFDFPWPWRKFRKRKIKKAIWRMYDLMKSRFTYTRTGMYVKGFRGGRKEYPIYLIYYVRMTLSDLMKSNVPIGRPWRQLMCTSLPVVLLVLIAMVFLILGFFGFIDLRVGAIVETVVGGILLFFIEPLWNSITAWIAEKKEEDRFVATQR